MKRYLLLKFALVAVIGSIFGVVHTLSEPAATARLYAHYATKDNTPFAITDDSVPLPRCTAAYVNLSTDTRYPIPHWVFSLPENADKALILAIAKTESVFRPRARSHRGATGLMQLMPDTAHYMIRKGALDTKIASNAPISSYLTNNAYDFTNPYVSLALGNHYINHLQERPYIGDNLTYILAAYNAGPGNVRKWKRRFGRVSDTRFTARIPFKETRNYVRKVSKDYQIYKKLLPQIDKVVWRDGVDC